MKGPVETKVAAGGGSGVLVTLLFGLAANYHWFTPPPPYLTALVVTAVTFASGWLAPHTPRPGVKVPLVLTAQEMDAIKRMLAAVTVVPATPSATGTAPPVVPTRGAPAGQVQPPATTTGPMA